MPLKRLNFVFLFKHCFFNYCAQEVFMNPYQNNVLCCINLHYNLP